MSSKIEKRVAYLRQINKPSYKGLSPSAEQLIKVDKFELKKKPLAVPKR